MNTIHFPFESLEVYQRSLSFAHLVYVRTQLWPKEHLFGITDQLRRASLSISLNIAEGYSRSRKDFVHFLSIARGSCYECIPIIKLANKLNLIDEKSEKMYYDELQSITQMINKLRTRLK